MMKDFGKPIFEVDASELLVVLRSLDLAIKNLSRWNAGKTVDTDILLPATSSYIKPVPKGLVLIIAPWNYPFNLSFIPLISALAGGNRIFLKPSEFAPNTGKLIQEIAEEVFDPTEVVCVRGAADVGAYLCGKDFDHIFFTGSKRIGSLVMEAAAKNLSSVTLELGGKNPVIADRDCDLKSLAEKVLHTKYLNAGQTCIASDYLVLPRKDLDCFVECWRQTLRNWFPKEWKQERDYSAMIHEDHFQRMLNLVNRSIEQGASLSDPLDMDVAQRRIKPVLLLHSDFNHRSMEEEIFGPILPVIVYDKEVEELFEPMKKVDRPLAMYVFSHRNSFIQKITSHLRAGGISINNTLINYCESNLPFGGDKHSGHGSTLGYHGFRTFVHYLPVAKQKFWLNSLQFFYPPYKSPKSKLLKWIIKLYS